MGTGLAIMLALLLHCSIAVGCCSVTTASVPTKTLVRMKIYHADHLYTLKRRPQGAVVTHCMSRDCAVEDSGVLL